ncbi:MAG: ABC transporter permease [Myxococcota bacterium]
MLDVDRWREITDSLRTAKLRTFATALSVAWGIFMLVILLGAGRGIQNGVAHNFRDDATNSLWLYGGSTSRPFRGYGVGRAIQLDDGDYEAVRKSIERVEYATGRFYLRGEFTVRVGRRTSSFDVRAVHPGHQYLERTIITDGRFINDTDLDARRKVAVIGPEVVTQLFGRRDPLGRYLDIGGTTYRVVGVFTDDGWQSELSKIYIPITTAQTVYGGGNRIDQIMFTIADATGASSRQTEGQLRQLMSARKDFHPDDEKAIRIRNNVEEAQKITGLFDDIDLFVWIVGIGTILAGMVGVSNIMLISVRERTKEIGLRKALGATPRTIVSQIVVESLLITSGSGYLGMVSGLGLIEVIARYAPENDYFRDPSANLSVVVGATVILVVCGVLAGYFPARLAARIQPVEALRAD